MHSDLAIHISFGAFLGATLTVGVAFSLGLLQRSQSIAVDGARESPTRDIAKGGAAAPAPHKVPMSPQRAPSSWTGCLVVGVAGGTGSGKTTLALAIREALGAETITYLSHDNYYKVIDQTCRTRSS